jgi:hypothetical protein
MPFAGEELFGRTLMARCNDFNGINRQQRLQMRRLFRKLVNLKIAVFVFVAAVVLPVYGQEVTSSQKTSSVSTVHENISRDFKRANPKSAVAREHPSTDKEDVKQQSTESSKASADQLTPQTYTFPTRRQRFNRYVSSTIGPFGLARTALSAGIEQWDNTPVEWGQGASGYGRRFASGLGRNAIQQTVTYGLDQALNLDTGFKRSKRKGFWPRLTDALVQNVTSLNRAGNRVISVPRLAGAYAGGIIPAETWYPSRYSYKDGLRSGTHTLLTGFGINVAREFLIRW